MSFQSAIVAVAVAFCIAVHAQEKPATKSDKSASRVEKVKVEKAALQARAAKDELDSRREDFQSAKEELKDANTKDRLKEHARKLSEELKDSTRKGGRPRE